MKRNSKYVGLDVHQAMTAATVRTEGGRVIVRSVIETSERSITEFFSGLGGTVHVAFEEGTQAQWLYDLLSPQVDRVIVCDVRGEKRSATRGTALMPTICRSDYYAAVCAQYTTAHESERTSRS